MYMKLKYKFTGSLAYFIGLFDWKLKKDRIMIVDYEYDTIVQITEKVIETKFSLN